MNQQTNQKPPRTHRNTSSPRRFIGTLIAIVVILVVYAYGFQVTKVDLEEPKTERRQNQLVNIIRGLARPRLLEYDEERLKIEAPVMMPCDPSVTLPPVDTTGRYIEVDPNCVELGGEVTITGHNFQPGETVYLFFVPYAASIHEEVELRLADEAIEVGPDGQFTYTVNMRDDRPGDQPQTIRAVVKLRSGLPHASKTLHDTIDKIIETIFLALIATTIGTALAIPISFLAARNLMSDIVSPFGSVMTGLLLAPLGWLVGLKSFNWSIGLAEKFIADSMIGLITLLFVAVALWAITRWLTQEYQGRWVVWRRTALGLGVWVLFPIGVSLLATLSMRGGAWLQAQLGPFGFLGNFIFTIADLIAVFLPLLGGLVGLAVISSLASSLAGRFLRRANPIIGRMFSVCVATLAGAMVAALLTYSIAWLYEMQNPARFMTIPTLVCGGVMLVIALTVDVERPVPTGIIIYTIVRTILNALRSIEPLIMVVAFAVWVGIGPFAGVMALALHTIAALGKLYSEQVENILSGPIEAILATGANRLQTIVYAVIPQIVPPYIAFTIYRWDINVRMSTIIGFGGGGGIGFLVQQNLNLLKYRDASVQMIAIAIVVATLDYASARVRERII